MNNSPKKVLLSGLPFPPISWWQEALQYDEVLIWKNEPFQKMSYLNRYYLAGKNGHELMSIPLKSGRSQKSSLQNVEISYAENWQKNHWRGIQTLLGNAPFFEFIDYQLLDFFQEKENNLYRWSMKSINWANTFLGNAIKILEIDDLSQENDYVDCRGKITPKSKPALPEYYQVFKQDTGFLTDCSILDLICCEGKAASLYLRDLAGYSVGN